MAIIQRATPSALQRTVFGFCLGPTGEIIVVAPIDMYCPGKPDNSNGWPPDPTLAGTSITLAGGADFGRLDAMSGLVVGGVISRPYARIVGVTDSAGLDQIPGFAVP